MDYDPPIGYKGYCLKIAGKYEFGEYFKNLALFINKTIKEKGIQKIIYKKIENYEKEYKNLEYKKEIFINNIGILYPKINEKDINIFYLFNNIKT
jgi:hypothetical protein